MNILITVENFYPPLGGAEYSLTTIAKKLSNKHNLCVIQAGETEEVINLDRIKVIKKKIPFPLQKILPQSFPLLKAFYWKKVLEKNLTEIKPDLIITQLNFSPPSITIASKYNIPTILFIRSYEHFCPIGFINGTDCDVRCKNCISLKSKICYPYIDKWLKWNGSAIINTDLIIANSNFVADLTKKWYGVKPAILYPTVDTKKDKLKNKSKKYITIVKPTKRKGADIFLKIAESLHDKEFVAVGGDETVMNKKVINSHPNVKFVKWTDDIEEIYAKTKILLAPSEWPEPFGRVIIEAGINGVPSIASNRGGLSEAVGDGGILIDDIYDIDKWIKSIEFIEDDEVYRKIAEKAIANARNFYTDHLIADFKQLVEKELSIKL